jgi:hypothetical protein
MKRLHVTTKTPAQIAAEFDTVFSQIKPVAVARPVTQAERLAPYRKVILKQRRRGLDWKQIATGMAQPPIQEKVSARVLKQVFGAAADASPATAVSNPSRLASGPAAASSPSPTVAAPAPMTPKEHEVFDPLLQGLIPPIVKVKMSRGDARSYANNAVEMMKEKDATRFHEILTAELAALNESNCARYGIPPEQIAPWRQKWGNA